MLKVHRVGYRGWGNTSTRRIAKHFECPDKLLSEIPISSCMFLMLEGHEEDSSQQVWPWLYGSGSFFLPCCLSPAVGRDVFALCSPPRLAWRCSQFQNVSLLLRIPFPAAPAAFIDTWNTPPSGWQCVCVKLSMRMTSWYLCYFLDVFSPWSSGKYLWCSSPRGWWIGLCGRLTNIHPARSTRKTGEKLCGEAAWESSYSLTLRCFHCLNVSVLCFVITEQLWKKWVSWDTHRDIWFTQQSKSFSA